MDQIKDNQINRGKIKHKKTIKNIKKYLKINESSLKHSD